MQLKGKKVFVTGADGFIGSHLTELLLKNECKVKALVQYNSFNSWGWLDSIPENSNLEIIAGDIRDAHFIKSAMRGTDIVFHLAALIAIPYSYRAPDCYIDTNVKGTLNICQAAKELGGIRVLCTSTSEVYGTAQYVPIDERHPKQPQSPYSASKIAADAIAMSFYNSFNLQVTIVRPFNTYGPRQSARAIIPSIITQIMAGMEEIKLGDLTTTRDFNYIKDTIQGFVAIAKCDNTIGKEINIASNHEVSMLETLNLIRKTMNSDVRFIMDDERLRPSNSEVYRLWGDNNLITTLTDWRPSFSLQYGIKETCEWFSDVDNLKMYKTKVYNI